MSLKEIARLSGASVSTVSRVLNRPEYHCSDPALQERIWKYAQELGYLPDQAARSLKLGKRQENSRPLIIDIFLTRFQSLDVDPFFEELHAALREELLQNGCHLGQFLTLPDVTELSRNLSPFPSGQTAADGLILLGKCPSELITPLKRRYHSLAGIDRNPTSFDYDEVVCSGLSAATAAMDYLVSLGHKKIAYIGDCSYEARYIGYYQSLITHRLPLDYSNIYPTSQTRQEGMKIMELLLQKDPLPSAIFCANDATALGVLDCLKKHRNKKYIPSIISIDNIQEAQQSSPSLTTIDIPKREMAHHAVKILLDRIRRGHKENIRVELPCRLIERESCSYVG